VAELIGFRSGRVWSTWLIWKYRGSGLRAESQSLVWTGEAGWLVLEHVMSMMSLMLSASDVSDVGSQLQPSWVCNGVMFCFRLSAEGESFSFLCIVHLNAHLGLIRPLLLARLFKHAHHA